MTRDLNYPWESSLMFPKDHSDTMSLDKPGGEMLELSLISFIIKNL